MRALRFHPGFTDYADGSVLIEMGGTRVLCSAMVEETVPPFLEESSCGWVTAEYSLLPSATPHRTSREGRKGGGVRGRTGEIQRIIGRALRAAVDLEALGERTIYIDCDVLQADGGTRTASINGGFVALALACRRLKDSGVIDHDPLRRFVGAVSVGIVRGRIVVDMDYEKDSAADVDMNVVMDEGGRIVEIQGTAEGGMPFSRTRLQEMLGVAWKAVQRIIRAQKRVLGMKP